MRFRIRHTEKKGGGFEKMIESERGGRGGGRGVFGKEKEGSPLGEKNLFFKTGKDMYLAI